MARKWARLTGLCAEERSSSGRLRTSVVSLRRLVTPELALQGTSSFSSAALGVSELEKTAPQSTEAQGGSASLAASRFLACAPAAGWATSPRAAVRDALAVQVAAALLRGR